MLALISSPRLRAWSENNVLMIAYAWFSSYSSALELSDPVIYIDLAPSTLQQQITSVLRLSQLSKTFMFEVRRELSWLVIDIADIDIIAQWSVESAEWRAIAQERGICQSVWFAFHVIADYPPLQISGELKLADLTRELASCNLEPGVRGKKSFSICISTPQFANGWVVRMWLPVYTYGFACIGLHADIFRLFRHGVSGTPTKTVPHVASLTSCTIKLTSRDPAYVPAPGVTLEAAWTNSHSRSKVEEFDWEWKGAAGIG